MSKLIAVTFGDHAAAFDLRAHLEAMRSHYFLGTNDVVVVSRDDEGKPRLHHATGLTAATAARGGWWGLLVGQLFVAPLRDRTENSAMNVLPGCASDHGIDEGFVRHVAKGLRRGCATVFVLVRDLADDKVRDGLDTCRGNGRIAITSLSRRDEDALRERLERA